MIREQARSIPACPPQTAARRRHTWESNVGSPRLVSGVHADEGTGRSAACSAPGGPCRLAGSQSNRETLGMPVKPHPNQMTPPHWTARASGPPGDRAFPRWTGTRGCPSPSLGRAGSACFPAYRRPSQRSPRSARPPISPHPLAYPRAASHSAQASSSQRASARAAILVPSNYPSAP